MRGILLYTLLSVVWAFPASDAASLSLAKLNYPSQDQGVFPELDAGQIQLKDEYPLPNSHENNKLGGLLEKRASEVEQPSWLNIAKNAVDAAEKNPKLLDRIYSLDIDNSTFEPDPYGSRRLAPGGPSWLSTAYNAMKAVNKNPEVLDKVYTFQVDDSTFQPDPFGSHKDEPSKPSWLGTAYKVTEAILKDPKLADNINTVQVSDSIFIPEAAQQGKTEDNSVPSTCPTPPGHVKRQTEIPPTQVDAPPTQDGAAPTSEATPPSSWAHNWEDVLTAFHVAIAYLTSGKSVGPLGNPYPHYFGAREFINNPQRPWPFAGFDERTRNNFQEFPVLANGHVYNGTQSPGPERVIIGQIGGRWRLAGVITHTGATGNSFVACPGAWGELDPDVCTLDDNSESCSESRPGPSRGGSPASS